MHSKGSNSADCVELETLHHSAGLRNWTDLWTQGWRKTLEPSDLHQGFLVTFAKQMALESHSIGRPREDYSYLWAPHSQGPLATSVCRWWEVSTQEADCKQSVSLTLLRRS